MRSMHCSGFICAAKYPAPILIGAGLTMKLLRRLHRRALCITWLSPPPNWQTTSPSNLSLGATDSRVWFYGRGTFTNDQLRRLHELDLCQRFIVNDSNQHIHGHLAHLFGGLGDGGQGGIAIEGVGNIVKACDGNILRYPKPLRLECLHRTNSHFVVHTENSGGRFGQITELMGAVDPRPHAEIPFSHQLFFKGNASSGQALLVARHSLNGVRVVFKAGNDTDAPMPE